LALTTFTGFHLHVRDMAATSAFYRLLGFDVPDDPHFAVFEFTEGVQVALGSYPLTRAYNEGFREPSPGGGVALQFNVPSRQAVDDLYVKLTTAGHAAELEPFDAWWGTRYAEVRDPDGNVVGFHSPLDASMRREMPGLT